MDEAEFEKQVEELWRAGGGGRGEPVIFTKAAVRSLMRSDLEHKKIMELRLQLEIEREKNRTAAK